MHNANIIEVMDAYKQNLDEMDIYSDELMDDFYELIYPEEWAY